MTPPASESRNPEREIASPPHKVGTMLPIAEPANIPIQTNFFVMICFCHRFPPRRCPTDELPAGATNSVSRGINLTNGC
jgi:hypothetical protein